MQLTSAGKLRVGLIGCGRVASMVHLPTLARLPNVELIAVAEPDGDRQGLIKRLAPAARTPRDYGELLSDSAIDAVVICLPTGLHASSAMQAFAAGKHVYLEKPVATTPHEADQVLDAWCASGRRGMVGFNYRFHPLQRSLRQAILGGRVGRITSIRSIFSSAARELPAWKRQRDSGGGVLLDLLSHHADLARYLSGREIAEVSAHVRSVRSADDTATVELRLDDGTLVQTTLCMSAVEDDCFEVFGDAGKLALDRHAGTLQWSPPRRHGSMPQRAARGAALLGRSAGVALRGLRSRPDPSFRLALAHFVESALNNRQPEVTIEDGHKSLAVVLAAEQAAQSRSVVAVPGAPGIVEQPLAATAAPLDLTGVRESIDDPSRPAMSVVLVTVDKFQSLRKVAGCLRRQTVARRIELVLVAPSAQALEDMRPDEATGFFGVRKLAVGEIENVDKSAAHGIRAAAAPIVALIEDHAYPDADYAQHIIAAHKSGPWAAVGSTINNANPDTVLSWANMLLSYGQWTDPCQPGETRSVSRHNVTFKTAVLLEYGERLEEKLGRDGGLLGELVSRGYRFYLEPRARVRHVNPSRWSSTLELRIGSGRLYGANRARREKWSAAKRAFYALAWPLIPFVRYLRLRQDLFGAPLEARRQIVGAKAMPALLLGVVLDGIGQMFGYAFGPGTAGEKLAFFEMHRARHLRSRDLHVMRE